MRPDATDAPDRTSTDPHPEATPPRVFAGGVLMGLANLVPGVSGGTMILALGLYDRFIESVADVARLRLSLRSVAFLVILALGLAVAIVGLATPAVWLVREHRWLAYSLFIGLTLGGVPMLWRIVRPLDAGTVAGTLAGVGVMAALAFGLQGTPLPPVAPVLAVVGALAASSMILPGVSGSYILLILGLYDTVVGSVRPAALGADPGGSLAILVPVAVGAVLGIGLLSNLLKLALARFPRSSHALLLGLLLGSILGLWPFQRPVHPDLADDHRMEVVEEVLAGEAPGDLEAAGLTEAEARALADRYEGLAPGELELMALELETYPPSPTQGAVALAVLLTGFAVTSALGGGGSGRRARDAEAGQGW